MACAPNRITLKTIAEHCDCSVNTVSLALRNDSRISEATLRKVQQAADELGYIRNNLASSLRFRKESHDCGHHRACSQSALYLPH